MIKIGTPIRIIKEINIGPDEFTPAMTIAKIGNIGNITGFGTKDSFFVKTKHQENEFSISVNEFEVLYL